MTNQEQLDAFLIRAKFSYGWTNLESSARRMVEHAVSEIDELRAENAALLAANLDCVDHYTQLRADFAALKKGRTREQDDRREGLGAHHAYCRALGGDV